MEANGNVIDMQTIDRDNRALDIYHSEGSTRADLLFAMRVLQRKADQIAYQVEEAEDKSYATGDKVDPEWYSRAKHALRITRQQVQELASRAKEARKEEEQEHKRTYERIFIGVVKRRIPSEQYNELVNEAKNELEAQIAGLS